jgi:dihydrofolate synthase/folylpolyglutamate synthase
VTYQEALAWLEGLLAHRPQSPQPYTPLKLERMRHLCALLGHPERAVPAVLVAGTKGKGSTAAMIAAIARAAGWRVGLYTKPHLVDFRERIRINGDLIAPDALASLVDELRWVVARGRDGPGWPPTYFEASAAAAFMHFARAQVDLAVVEVGIGGRLDATNVMEPMVSVITTAGYDHTDMFGHNLRRIAAEDTGIMRPGRVVVTAPQPPAAREVIEQAAAAHGALLVRVGREVRHRTLRSSRDGVRLTVSGRDGRYRDLAVPLLGRHQATNAAVAVAVAEALTDAGFAIPEAAVRSGLAGLRWPARIEVIRERPTIIVDVAHNVVSFRALRAVLDDVFTGRWVTLVIGVLGSKDLAGIARTIGPRAAVVVATTAHDERALPAFRVAEAFHSPGADIHVVEDLVGAIEFALRASTPHDLICVAGSFHVAGPIRAHLLSAPAARETVAVTEPLFPVATGADEHFAVAAPEAVRRAP